MLDNLREDIANLSSFDWGIELENIIETNSDAIVQLQEEQLYEGTDRKGQQVTLEGKGYAKSTFEIKTAKGQPTDRITWSDTRALYGALQAAVNNGEVSLSAPSEQEKFDAMIFRSGEDVVGLDDSRRVQFGENITLPAIRQIFNSKTGFVIQ